MAAKMTERPTLESARNPGDFTQAWGMTYIDEEKAAATLPATDTLRKWNECSRQSTSSSSIRSWNG